MSRYSFRKFCCIFSAKLSHLAEKERKKEIERFGHGLHFSLGCFLRGVTYVTGSENQQLQKIIKTRKELIS